jgi:hypothetical protein
MSDLLDGAAGVGGQHHGRADEHHRHAGVPQDGARQRPGEREGVFGERRAVERDQRHQHLLFHRDPIVRPAAGSPGRAGTQPHAGTGSP